MPLNMNTVGTGTGIGSSNGGGASETSILSREVSEIPMNQYPAYYVNYNEIIPTKTDTFRTLSTTSELPFVQIFTFKGYTWGVSTNIYDRNSSTYSTSVYTVTVSKLHIVGSSFSTETVFTFSSEWTDRRRPYILVGKEYLYFIRMILNEEYTYNGTKYTADRTAYLCRYDGTSEERIKPVYIGSTYHPLYGKDICTECSISPSLDFECFTWLDYEKEIILFGYFTKYIRIYTNPYKAETYSSPAPVTWNFGNGTGSYFTFGYSSGDSGVYTNLYGFVLLKDKGFLCDKINKNFVQFDFIDNDGESFTIQNAVSLISSYWDNGGRINMSEPNVYTCSGSKFRSKGYMVSPPIVMYYNYKTKSADVISKPWTSTDTLNGYGSLSYGNSSVIAHLDRLKNRILFASCRDDGNADGRSIAIQPCTINYITGYSNTSNSILSAYFHKGDTIYCSSAITDYVLDNSGNHTSISGSPKKFVIPSDGSYEIRSIHGDGTYVPSWVAIDNNSNLIYLKYYKIDSTHIHGWFIPNMQVNEKTIVYDGEQTLELSDFSKTGITISMKGVK